ncbi:hypothetical protein [Microbacterium sp.]|uniref:hypothetical protein n=1 Tax=Microbacterium sp. TaxID=51671 RepID=UPI002FE34DFA
MRMPRIALLLLASVVVLSGCVPFGFACTTIGHGSVIHVTLAQPRPGLDVELCAGAGCIPGPPDQGVQLGATEVPASTGIFGLSGSSETGWTASIGAEPKPLRYTVLDATGAVVASGEADVAMMRIDGTEQCGGNMEGMIELPV